MKKKIFISMLALAFVALIATAVVSVFVYYSFFENQVKIDTKAQASYIKSGYEEAADKQAFLQSLPSSRGEHRISLIEPDGNVSFDTYADANDLYDHLDRPEIAGAIQNGNGEAMRYSKTLQNNSFYYALMLDDGNIIRVAALTSSIGSVFSSIMPPLILLLVLMLFASFLLSRLLTNRIVRPLEHLSDHLEDLSEDDNYDELNPFVEKISRQNDTIQKQLKKSKEERDTITLITDNMQEGLVLMGRDRYMLSVNKAAVAYLNRHSDMDFVGENLIVLTREKALLEAADKALSGDACDGVFYSALPNSNGALKRAYHYFANPVFSKEENDRGAVKGAILLLLDVTSQQKAEKIRREFSANVSHELKTPLTTISGFSEMIQNDMVQSHDDLIRFAGIISKESGRLLALIDDIIKLSQMDEGEKSVEMQMLDIAEIVEEVCERLLPKAKDRNVTLEKQLVSVRINSNRPMLQEVIYNLVDNAIKYNVDGGQVQIDIAMAKGANLINLCVSDTGIGIDSSHHDRLFERFYRVDKSRSKQTGGTGLGLSIVKHSTELLGGCVSLDSAVGKGTKITVSLPA